MPSRLIFQARDFGGGRGGERSVAEAYCEAWRNNLADALLRLSVTTCCTIVLGVLSCGSLPWLVVIVWAAQSRRWSSDAIRFNIGKHVPKNCRNSTHDRHTRDLGTATQFDAAIPVSHFGIVLEKVDHQLTERKTSKATSFLGNRTCRRRLWCIPHGGRASPSSMLGELASNDDAQRSR